MQFQALLPMPCLNKTFHDVGFPALGICHCTIVALCWQKRERVSLFPANAQIVPIPFLTGDCVALQKEPTTQGTGLRAVVKPPARSHAAQATDRSNRLPAGELA
eukprot:5266180-Amphidinium_carterae.3